MCTQKELYKSNEKHSHLVRRKRGAYRLTRSQIDRATDSLRILANRNDISIADMSKKMNDHNCYPLFYKVVREQPELSAVQIANKMQKNFEQQ